jgi:signal transduction histidine kinase
MQSVASPAERVAAAGERVVILAPIGQDARLLAAVVGHAGLQAEIASDAHQLIERVGRADVEGLGLLLIAEEALTWELFAALERALGNQPSWSDLPIILLTSSGAVPDERSIVLGTIRYSGTVTLIERPFRAITLTSAVQAALRSRRRQFEVRDHLVQQQRSAEALASKAAELERSNSELEQFAYIASHDLQEPTRMIISYLQLIERELGAQMPERARRYFGMVDSSARRMQDMVRSILDYSCIGKGEETQVEMDVGLAIDHALRNLEGKIREAGAEITVGRMPRVRANPAELTRLFQNLISNAIKFRPPQRQPRVAISCVRHAGTPAIAIADNGIGIGREEGRKLFGIFQRTHPADLYPGTGIGLAACKKIVEHHGGRIWFESQPGVGTTFFFVIDGLHHD